MYTEIYVKCLIKDDAPPEVIDILKHLFDKKGPHLDDLKLPGHKLFSLPRWGHIGNSGSHYHVPHATSDFRHNEIARTYFLVSRSDFKNYNSEIEHFFNWIDPFIDAEEGEFIGYELYEENQIPTLYLKGGGQNEKLRRNSPESNGATEE